MRGSGEAPAATASRSEPTPAQKTAKRARVSPPARAAEPIRPGRGLHPLDAAVDDHRRARGRRAQPPAPAPPPRSRRCPSPASAAPPRPRQCGSISASSAADSRRSPGTSFSRPRRSSSSSAAQLALVARHDHLPAALVRGSPARSQNSYISRAPSTHSRAFSEPGHVVDAGVDDAAVGARSARRPTAGPALQHDRVDSAGPAPLQLARHRQPEDAAADDGQVALLRRGRHLSPLASGARRWPAAPGRSRPSA